jgi:hypothetical protein
MNRRDSAKKSATSLAETPTGLTEDQVSEQKDTVVS